MTRPVVMDASVALALLLREPPAPFVRMVMEYWLSAGVSIIVPDHFWLEVLNRLGRRGRGGAEIVEALRDLDVSMLRTVGVDRPLLLLANDLMERHGLTAYDAAYLALAHATGATLATFDSDLRRAAGDLLDTKFVEEGGAPGHRLTEAPAPYAEDAVVTWQRWSGAGSYLGTLRRRALAELDAATASKT